MHNEAQNRELKSRFAIAELKGEVLKVIRVYYEAVFEKEPDKALLGDELVANTIETSGTEPIYRSDFDVVLTQHAGSDGDICRAARVSTMGAESLETDEAYGLINFLMKNRHGSPFEHGFIQFRITAPIFVWREFMRHRIGFSYNEESGRYKVLDPVFYIPNEERNLVQEGKAGEYRFTPGDRFQIEMARKTLTSSYMIAWSSYSRMMKQGIAKEVARMCLPVATYSTAYVSCNPRSMMSFLSLRTKHEGSTFPSFPMDEINRVADAMEEEFKKLYPLTHRAFNENGRVSP